ncbi:MAG: efflux RND transporter periplasmic adaptor subunit, partial [Acidobacteriota bacterium]|nr:efflux RND transporter periplasmic adaptor subunit [Acidobacteriota bacterium]
MEHQTNSQQISTSPNRKRRIVVITLLVAIAAVITVAYLMRGSRGNSIAGRPVPEPSAEFATAGADASSASAPRPDDVLIEVSPEKLINAHLKIEAATAQSNASMPDNALRSTGTVEANAYKETPVLPIAGGIVREVYAQLGDNIAKGQRLAVIFSTELSEAQAGYLKMLAEIEKHHHHYQRIEKLVEIGAASREEFEQATAEYKTEQANLSSIRQKLMLLGMTAKQLDEMGKADQVSSLITVEAPTQGT